MIRPQRKILCVTLQYSKDLSVMVFAYFLSLFSTGVIWKQKHIDLHSLHSATSTLHCHRMIQSGRSFWSAGNQEKVRTTLTSLAEGLWGRGTYGWKGSDSRTSWWTQEEKLLAGCTPAWRLRTWQGNRKESHVPLGTGLEWHLQRRHVKKVHPHALMQTPLRRLWFA